MDTLTTGYWVIHDSEGDPKKSQIHFVSDGLPFCTTPIKSDAESVIVSYGAKMEYGTCKRCRQKYRKERCAMEG